MSAPKDRRDSYQDDKDDEPGDNLIEQDAVGKIKTEGANES